MQIPNPAGMELKDWADAVTFVTSQYASTGALHDKDWQNWGMTFFNTPQLATLQPPNPYFFDDWQSWGERLSESLSNARGSQSRAAA